MKEIVINNWQEGIGQSPHVGFGDMRNIDIKNRPGVARINVALDRMTPSAVAVTFTADAGTDKITISSGNLYNDPNLTSAEGRAVTFSTTTTLPAPLATSTTYWLINGGTSTTYKVATSLANAIAGTAIDITDAGTGTHTVTSVNMGIPQFFAKEPSSGNLYMQDSNARVWNYGVSGSGWVLISGNTTTNGNAQGLVIWENYLFAFRSARVDVYGSLTVALGSRAWTNDWQTLTASAGESNDHFAYVSSINNRLYFADRDTTTGKPYVGSVKLATGTFDPATASTYTYTAQDLDLPAYKVITCMEDLGNTILVGTIDREIYVWDGTEESWSNIIFAPEPYIGSMRTFNNVTYFSAGERGNIYATVGSSAVLFKEFPESILNYPTGISYNIKSLITHQGKLLFTLAGTSSAISGVYSIDMNTRALVLENVIGLGTYVSSAIPCLYSDEDSYYCGWYSGSVGGIDRTYVSGGDYYRQTSYGAYIETPMYEVGTETQKRDFGILEFNLAKPLTTGQGIRISYRTSTSASYTIIGTFDFTTYGGIQSFHKRSPNIPSCIMVQLKIELTTGTDSTTTPELKSVILKSLK